MHNDADIGKIRGGEGDLDEYWRKGGGRDDMPGRAYFRFWFPSCFNFPPITEEKLVDGKVRIFVSSIDSLWPFCGLKCH